MTSEVNLSLAISNLSNLLGSLRDAEYFAIEADNALCDPGVTGFVTDLTKMRERVLGKRGELVERRRAEDKAKLQRENKETS